MQRYEKVSADRTVHTLTIHSKRTRQCTDAFYSFHIGSVLHSAPSYTRHQVWSCRRAGCQSGSIYIQHDITLRSKHGLPYLQIIGKRMSDTEENGSYDDFCPDRRELHTCMCNSSCGLWRVLASRTRVGNCIHWHCV